MPSNAATGRTKTVETKTTEEVPIGDRESAGLGMPWQDYLASLTDEELAITEVKIYQVEPRTQEGYIAKVSERVDEEWIKERFGGGVFNVRIAGKNGKSHFERNVRIVGPSKPPATQASVAASAAPVTDVATERLIGLLDKTIERLERLQNSSANPPAAQEQVVEILSSAAKKAVEIAGGTNKPAEDSFDKDLQRLKLMREIFVPAKQDDDLDKQLKKAMVDRLLAPPQQTKSLIEELKALMELRELLGDSGGGGGKEDWKTALIHAAPQALDKLVSMSDARLQASQVDLRRAEVLASARSGAGTPPHAPAAPPPSAAAASPSPSPGPVAPPSPSGPLRMTPMGAPAANPGPAPGVAPPLQTSAIPPAGPLNTESVEVVDFVKQRIVDLVKQGEPGGAIVGFLLGMRQEKFAAMLQRYPPDQITTFLKADPILKEAAEHEDWGDVLREAKEFLSSKGGPDLVQ